MSGISGIEPITKDTIVLKGGAKGKSISVVSVIGEEIAMLAEIVVTMVVGTIVEKETMVVVIMVNEVVGALKDEAAKVANIVVIR